MGNAQSSIVVALFNVFVPHVAPFLRRDAAWQPENGACRTVAHSGVILQTAAAANSSRPLPLVSERRRRHGVDRHLSRRLGGRQ